MGFQAFMKRRGLKVSDDRITRAVDMTLRESIFPIALVTILFFLWGFSYGLLDTLNKHFQTTLNVTRARSAGLQAAYFGAYPLASLGHAAWILRHYSYKAVFIWGLFLYGLGALIAIPCIKAKSFAGFCAAIFIIGNGLGSLETAANPFITVCGPSRYSEMRINLSQAFNGIGGVLAPLIGSYVFFNLTDEEALANVQWVYLAIASFVLLLAVVFFFATIPEITDADMAAQVEQSNTDADSKPFRKQYRLFHASLAQFSSVGAQIATASFFINFATETRSNTSDQLGSQLFAGAQGTFALGRFIGVILMKFFLPRWVFFAFMTGVLVFLGPTITQRENTGVAFLYVVFFFQSICFPSIIALGMKGLGRHTKRGSGFLVAGGIGGACIPPLTGVVADKLGTGKAMIVPMAFVALAWSFPIAINFVPSYRNVIDAFVQDGDSESRVEERKEVKEEREERDEKDEK